MREIGISGTSETTGSKMYKTDPQTGRIIMSAEIYRNLSSIMGNSNIVYVVDPKSSYQEFIKDYDELYLAESTLSNEQKGMMMEIDLYLGSLGMTEKYPIVSDRVGNQVKVNAHFKGSDNA